MCHSVSSFSLELIKSDEEKHNILKINLMKMKKTLYIIKTLLLFFCREFSRLLSLFFSFIFPTFFVSPHSNINFTYNHEFFIIIFYFWGQFSGNVSLKIPSGAIEWWNFHKSPWYSTCLNFSTDDHLQGSYILYIFFAFRDIWL